MPGTAGMAQVDDNGLVGRNWFAITPSDTLDTAHDLSLNTNANCANKGLYVSVAGNLNFQTVDGSAFLAIAVTAGQYIYAHVRFVKSTGTSATVIGIGG